MYLAERAGSDPASVPALRDATATLEAVESKLDDLQAGDRALYERFVASAHAVAGNPRDSASLATLTTLGPSLFAVFDAETASYGTRAAAQRQTIRVMILVCGAATVVILGLLYFFVMRRREESIVSAFAALEERRRRFAAMFDNSSEMMALYTSDGAIVRANRTAIERLGFGIDAIGSPFGIHVAQRDLEMAMREFARAAAGEAVQFAATFVDVNGAEVPVVTNLTPIVVNGTVVGVTGSARDVARERQFEMLLLRSRERFRSLFKLSTHSNLAIDAEGIVTDLNPAMAQLTGYEAGDLVGQSVLKLAPAGGQNAAVNRLAEILSGKATSYETRIRTRDGDELQVECDVTPIVVSGSVEGSFITLRDMTQERAMLRQLDEKDVLVRGLLDVAASTFEPSAHIDFALAVGARALGTEYGYVIKTRGDLMTIVHRTGPDDFLPAGHTMPVTQAVGGRLASSAHAVALNDLTGEPFAGELAERGLPWKSYIGSRIATDGTPYGALVFLDRTPRRPPFEQAHLDFVDVLTAMISSAVAREISADAMRDRAIHDPLTGLPNRSLLDEHFSRMIARARRSDGGIAIFYVDLDGFKPINDTYGHAAGDAVLRSVARRFLRAARGEDVVARLGGDEFVILQTEADDAAITALSSRLRASLQKPIELPNGGSAFVDASIGVGRYPGDGEDLDTILQAADAEMYRAKRAKPKRAGGAARS
jgi:diguanylate cyclase (GGDEF)-like protein/PAS domain S-box-containing protein